MTAGRNLARLLALALPLVLPADAGAERTLRLGEDSELTFVAIQAGAPFTGRFESFDARIVFDPDAMEESSFEVRIIMSSVNTDYKDRDEILRGPDFFDVQAFPEATFEAREFSRLGKNEYVADGTLKIRDKEQPLRLPFSFSASSSPVGQWLLNGSVVINRFDYGVGMGEWRDPEWVGRDVTVKFRLKLSDDTS